MEHIVNEDIMQYVNNGELSADDIEALIEVRDFINRISAKEYMEAGTIEDLTEKYGTPPTVTTWGDYYQTEIAYEKIKGTIEDIQSAVCIVKFDMMSSHIIFSEKEISFHEWVEARYEKALESEDEMSQNEINEAVHLKILKDYFVSLGINGAFTEAELSWYDTYREYIAV